MQSVIYLRKTGSLSGEPILPGDEYCPDANNHSNRRLQAMVARRLVGVGEVLRTKEEIAHLWEIPKVEETIKGDTTDENTEDSSTEEETTVEDTSGDEEDEADDENSEAEYTKTQVRKMSEDELEAVISARELSVNLSEHSSKKKKATAVIDALADKELI